MSFITDVAGLERHLGRAPAARDVKVIPYLDDGARSWIEASRLAFIAFASAAGPRLTLAGIETGFAGAGRDDVLTLPRAALDQSEAAAIGEGVGTLFLVPRLRETLRVNGRVAAVGPDSIDIAVDECFVHCAKALIRSDFWAPPDEVAPSGIEASVDAGRFMALATADEAGRCDVSPKGDPAGRLIQSDGEEAWFAERPGNRRADGYRNLLSASKLSAALLVPGRPVVAYLSGRAEISDREDLRARFVVKDKAPLLVTRIAELRIELTESEALKRSRIWEPAPEPTIDAGAVMARHVSLNRSGGLQAAAARALVKVPGLMKWGLESDYKRNLY